LKMLQGHRRYQLLDEQGQVVHTFHDPLTEHASAVLEFLRVSRSAYGLPSPTSGGQ
jgi:hypothetical protein